MVQHILHSIMGALPSQREVRKEQQKGEDFQLLLRQAAGHPETCAPVAQAPDECEVGDRDADRSFLYDRSFGANVAQQEEEALTAVGSRVDFKG